MTDDNDTISRAIAAAGGHKAVAQALGLNVATVYQWRDRGRVPAHWIVSLCDMGGDKVLPRQLASACAPTVRGRNSKGRPRKVEGGQ